MKTTMIRTAVFALAMTPAAALAQTAGSVTADLNLREGPGSNYTILTTIPNGSEVTINGCVADTSWCEVTYGPNTGFAYAQYLNAVVNSETVVVSERRGAIPTIAAETVDAVGNTLGAVTGALVGTVVGAGEGLVQGAERGADTFHVADQTVVYVEQNPVEPVYLEGEVVVGVGVPENVTLYEVPNAEYRYVNINGTDVLVDPDTRQVVYVVR